MTARAGSREPPVFEGHEQAASFRESKRERKGGSERRERGSAAKMADGASAGF